MGQSKSLQNTTNSSSSPVNDTEYMSSQPDSEYVLQEFDNFFTPEECDYVINIAKDQLMESKVYATQNEDALDTQVRDSKQCWLYDNDFSFIKEMSEDVSRITGVPSNMFESLQVVRYEKGGFYKPHHDACVGTEEFCKRANQQFDGQQRYITFLVYLNDDFEGGETHFPKINYTVKPKKGKAVLFHNVDSSGKVLPASLHGGNPVTKGTKWICNKWVHLPKSMPIKESYQSSSKEEIRKICESTFNGVGIL